MNRYVVHWIDRGELQGGALPAATLMVVGSPTSAAPSLASEVHETAPGCVVLQCALLQHDSALALAQTALALVQRLGTARLWLLMAPMPQPEALLSAGLPGLARCVREENPSARLGCISAFGAAAAWRATLALAAGACESEVAVRRGRQLLPRLAPALSQTRSPSRACGSDL